MPRSLFAMHALRYTCIYLYKKHVVFFYKIGKTSSFLIKSMIYCLL